MHKRMMKILCNSKMQILLAFVIPVIMMVASWGVSLCFGGGGIRVLIVPDAGEFEDWVQNFRYFINVMCISCMAWNILVVFVTILNERMRTAFSWYMFLFIGLILSGGVPIWNILFRYPLEEGVFIPILISFGLILITYLLTYIMSSSKCTILWRHTFFPFGGTKTKKNKEDGMR